MTNTNPAVSTAVAPSSPDPPPTIWPSVPYPDPQAAIDFLVAAFGFEPTALIPDDEPGSHAEIELRWPHGSGGIIIRRWDRPAPTWLYVVTPDPDSLYQRVKAAGAGSHPGTPGHSLRQPHVHGGGPLVGHLDLRNLPRQLTGHGHTTTAEPVIISPGSGRRGRGRQGNNPGDRGVGR